MFISIWARNRGGHIVEGVIEAFILAVTIVVVAIPEGLCSFSAVCSCRKS